MGSLSAHAQASCRSMRPAKHDDGLRAAGSLCTHVVFAHTVQTAQSAHCLCPPSRLSRHSQSMQNFVLSRFRGLGQQAHRTRPDDARLQPWLQRWHNLGCLPSAIGCRSEHRDAPRSHLHNLQAASKQAKIRALPLAAPTRSPLGMLQGSNVPPAPRDGAQKR